MTEAVVQSTPLVSTSGEALPLVSCIMPTKDRRPYVAGAIEYFLRQDYPNRELIILDSGEDAVADLVPEHPMIHYVRCEVGLCLGSKRNLACERARGELISHWDDDDWSAPWRLRVQVQQLLADDADMCGLASMLYYDAQTKAAWRYEYPKGDRPWVGGCTMLYRRDLWLSQRFEDLHSGEDNRFVWRDPAPRIAIPEDGSFHVALVHGGNASPKHTNTVRWRPIPIERIEEVMGSDFRHHGRARPSRPAVSASSSAATPAPRPAASGFRNLYACLVHERPDCVADLVRNLRYLDPQAHVLLYDGSPRSSLLRGGHLEGLGAMVHPTPRPMKWGYLHDFALDCMRYGLQAMSFDALTIVDSDQLAIRSGFTPRLGEYLAEHEDAGILTCAPHPQRAATAADPAKTALRENNLWQSFFERYPGPEQERWYWTFWPTTVFTAKAARDLLAIFEDEQLRSILGRSRLWATEEVLFPTLTALLGHDVLANPGSYDYVKYRARYSVADLDAAMGSDDCFWVHPVPRDYDDPLRRYIRERHGDYVRPASEDEASVESRPADERREGPPVLRTLPIVRAIRPLKGWLDDDEADLLVATTREALALPGAPNVVEVGSFCGRATVAMGMVARTVDAAHVFAVDAFDGVVGAAGDRLEHFGPTLERFTANVDRAGLQRWVTAVPTEGQRPEWSASLAMLVVDGLHDYANVSADLEHFERWLRPGGYLVFHDYAPYFPGVTTLVDEVLARGDYGWVAQASTLVVLRKREPKEDD
ncbi:MAG: glycosyltransferase [Myxococcota bacterium]